jgi:hypothetical protein
MVDIAKIMASWSRMDRVFMDLERAGQRGLDRR